MYIVRIATHPYVGAIVRACGVVVTVGIVAGCTGNTSAADDSEATYFGGEDAAATDDRPTLAYESNDGGGDTSTQSTQPGSSSASNNQPSDHGDAGSNSSNAGSSPDSGASLPATCTSCANSITQDQISAQCSGPMNACRSSQDCQSFIACVGNPPDQSKLQGCASQYAAGFKQFQDFDNCVFCNICAAECTGACQ
jgi:hypothetical protein